MGGDWKQLTPVVLGGNNYAQFVASVKNSDLFRDFARWQLRINHRLEAGQQYYRDFLLKVGTGLLNDNQQRIRLPESMCMSNMEELFEWIFPQQLLDAPLENWEEFSTRVLSPLNKETLSISRMIMVRTFSFI